MIRSCLDCGGGWEAGRRCGFMKFDMVGTENQKEKLKKSQYSNTMD